MLASNLELLKHIQDEISFVLHNTNNKTQEEVVNDAVLSRAIIRSLEIIGEASKKLDESFKANYAYVEWRKIAGTRNKLIHDYFGVDYDIIWNIVTTKLPELQSHISKIIKENK